MSDEPVDFDEHAVAWRDYRESPWGRVRYAVVAHSLNRIFPAASPGLRILDVGGGDGADALVLARAGHHVTILDAASGMLGTARDTAATEGLGNAVATLEGSLDDLAEWAPDGFDAVLCHFLLQYRSDTKADIRLLARVLKPGGLVSLIAPNPAGLVLAAAARRGPNAAEEELNRHVSHTVAFHQNVRKIDYQVARRLLDEEGLTVEAQYGGRCVNDLITDDQAKWDPAYYADLERLELALHDEEPYKLVGQYWHLVARLGEAPAP